MNNSILIVFCHVKSEQVNFCPGELILKLLARIGEWPQNLNEKTETVPVNGPLFAFNYHTLMCKGNFSLFART